MTELCILISTYDKNIQLAELTIELINERWKEHPPIFVCGLENTRKNDIQYLPFEGDFQDWTAIILSASDQLLKKGYRKCYIILDDHPPLGVCNHDHLNKTIPELMNQLGAVYIGLHGWDQNTLSDGTVFNTGNCQLQKQSDSFLWRFSLHPALWDIATLYDMADNLIKTTEDLSQRSIWSFERGVGTNQNTTFGVGRSYRISGLEMLGGRFIWLRRFLRKTYYMMLRLFYMIAYTLGTSAQEKTSEHFIYETLFFDGPYPMYWSGVMQKGKLNTNLERYFSAHLRNEELIRFKNVLRTD